MADIDLIPSDYRQRLSTARTVKTAVLMVLLVLLLNGLVIFALLTMQNKAQTTADSLTTQYVIAEQKQSQLASLSAQLKAVEEQIYTLEGLKGGGRITRLFNALDKALDRSEVRFLHWDVYRTAKFSNSKDKIQAYGFSWQLPQQLKSQRRAEIWRVDLAMEIRAHARNYSLLSDFVDNMLAQPEFEVVEIDRSKLREIGDDKRVEFVISVIVNSKEMSQ